MDPKMLILRMAAEAANKMEEAMSTGNDTVMVKAIFPMTDDDGNPVDCRLQLTVEFGEDADFDKGSN